MVIVLSTTLIIVTVAIIAFVVDHLQGRLTTTTKWADLTWVQWLMVAGMAQLPIVLTIVSIIVQLRT